MPWTNTRTWLDVSAKNNNLRKWALGNVDAQNLGRPNIRLDIVRYISRFVTSPPTPPSRPQPRYIKEGSYEEPYKKLVVAAYTTADLTLCDVGTEYVEAHVSYSRAAQNGDPSCFISKIRRTPDSKGLGNFTALDIGRTQTVLKHILYTLATFHPTEYSILEKLAYQPAHCNAN